MLLPIWCACKRQPSSAFFLCPAGLKFAQLVVGPEEQAQLAALGISKTPALVALKGSDLSQRTLYEGERRGVEVWELGNPAAALGGGSASSTTGLAALCPPIAGELKAPRILEWLKQLASGIQGSGRQERVVGDADVLEAKDKAAKGSKQAEQGSKAEGGKEGKKEQKEKVPAEIPQVRSRRRCAGGVVSCGRGRQREHMGMLHVTSWWALILYSFFIAFAPRGQCVLAA